MRLYFEERKVLQPGRYLVEIEDAMLGEGKTSGQPVVTWTFRLLEGEPGRRLFFTMSLQPQALWRLQALLRALGERAEGEFEFEPEDYIGRRVIAEVVTRERNGEEREDIARFLPAGKAPQVADQAKGAGRPLLF